ncbi:MAG: FAD-dependent monooxygenase, partial [Myxococcales bacterium]|nr:FAD-dependent monooxygenase [Myxococcales bacterium]
MSDLDVLIVGAGPVGLTLACEAARHGLKARLIDIEPEASVHSKAQIVHARTLEIL